MFKIIDLTEAFHTGMLVMMPNQEGMISICNDLTESSILLNLGYLSSIATLVMFLIYFIGRIWLMFKCKKTINEKLFRSNDLVNFHHEITIDDNSNSFYLTASQYLNSVKIYNCVYHKSINIFLKKKLLNKFDSLQEGEIIKINATCNCGIPSKILVYEREDFTLGKILISENGFDGSFSIPNRTHTIKSILYYLVK